MKFRKPHKVLASTVVAVSMSTSLSLAGAVYSSIAVDDSGQNVNLGQSFKVQGITANALLDVIRVRSAHSAGSESQERFTGKLNIFESKSDSIAEWKPGPLLGSSYPVSINPEKNGFSSVYSFTFEQAIVLKPNAVYLVEVVPLEGEQEKVRISFGESAVVGEGDDGHAFIRVGSNNVRSFAEQDFGMEVLTRGGAGAPPVIAAPSEKVEVLVEVSGVSLCVVKAKKSQ